MSPHVYPGEGRPGRRQRRLHHAAGVAHEGEHRPVGRLEGREEEGERERQSGRRGGAREEEGERMSGRRGAERDEEGETEWGSTWPGSTSRSVAPGVARTAAAIASITWATGL